MTTDNPIRQRVIDEFSTRFGTPPSLVVRAPGRVNLIGEHTDYNDGFVLPMAIDREVWIALQPRDDRRISAYSFDFEDAFEFDIDEVTALESRPITEGPVRWSEYVRGVTWALARAGHTVAGWNGIVAGNVPKGAGLSSSAALELAVARALTSASGASWNAVAMAKLAQRAENAWVGVNCGIMDQLISSVGVAQSALLIDCRSLETRPVPIPQGVAVVILDTKTRRGLVDSAYNERRKACEATAAAFGVPALRDVTMEMFEARSGELDEVTQRRAKHVISENARTLAAANALARGDAQEMGRLMNESHRSLRDDFEVSRKELDVVVELAQSHPAGIGARMTGAGFGGCAVALVDETRADSFIDDVTREYSARVGLTAAVYQCVGSPGASAEQIEVLKSVSTQGA